MTILEIIQAVARQARIHIPTSAIGSSDEDSLLMLSLAEEALRTITAKYNFPQLIKRASITLVEDQANYALPGDYKAQLPNTHWNTTTDWPLIGPVNAVEWETMVNGVITSAIHPYFRIEGYADKQFYLHPTPNEGDDGSIITFSYISSNFARPKTWVTATSFAAGSYCFYNGNYYSTSSGGTTGATAPTHTSGTVSDGTVQWTYYSTPYRKFLNDEDVCLLSSDCLIKDILWRWLRAGRFEFIDLMQESEDHWKLHYVETRGSSMVQMGSPSGRFLGVRNIPETGYGA